MKKKEVMQLINMWIHCMNTTFRNVSINVKNVMNIYCTTQWRHCAHVYNNNVNCVSLYLSQNVLLYDMGKYDFSVNP